MSAVTLPQARIPLGWANVNGTRVPIEIDIEWMRAFSALVSRTGGTVAPTIDVSNLLAAINAKPALFAEGGDGDGWTMPGPQGLQGLQGAAGFMFRGNDGEDGAPGFCVGQTPYRVALNATASRALNTTYTNVSTSILMVHLTVRCAVTLAGGNAYVQALMDTASPPTVIATGLVGIQAGLLGEDNTFQMVFFVNPGGTYRVNSSATNGTVTLGNWFELPI